MRDGQFRLHESKGHAGTPGNEKVDALAGRAAEKKKSWSPITSIAHLKLQAPEKYRAAKEAWHKDLAHYETEEILSPPPKKSCMDKTRSALARTTAQIQTGYWRSAVFLKRMRERKDNKCWSCPGPPA